jgi:ribosomal protein S18 acetylase RimI-like enzyme
VSIAVRRATPEDDRFISALGSTCAASSISQIRRVSEPVVALSFQRLLMFCRERPGTIDLIAEVDGERAGFLILLTDIPDDVTQREQAFVAFMAVSEPVRRTGVGKALMRNAETEARRLGLPHLSLMVSADNAAARALYAAAGFVEERTLLTKPLGEPTPAGESA